jgi:acyl-CoA thioesterase I
MDPIILRFADGTSFFAGLAMAAVADLLLLRFRAGLMRAVLTVLALAGIIFVVISATPLPVWAYAVWLFVAVASLVTGNIATCRRNVRSVMAGLVVITTTAFGLAEFPYHRLPHIDVPRGTNIYVLGDSISAGMGTKHKCWPVVLSEMTSLSVVNLAQPGATVQSALKQADGIAASNAVVVVEIGGNDMLGDADATTFRNQLDVLLSSLRLRQHQVMMLELPLFPFKNAFGEAQRELAAKHGVSLLPKRCFTKVLGTKNGTLDGLHLAQDGHDAMAKIIAGVIQEK